MVSVAVPRWWLQVAALVVAIAMSGVACSNRSEPQGRPPPSPTDIAPPQARFAFSYRALGTSVLDCVVPNRRFTGQVHDDETFVLIADDGAEVLHRDATTYLDSALFDDRLDLDSWLSVADQQLSEAIPSLQTAIGADLASFLRSGASPVDGNTSVRAALETGAEPVPIAPFTRRDGSAVPGWRVALPDGGTDDRGVRPVLSYWLDDAEVVRVVIQDSRPGEPGEPDPDTGWLIDYQALPDGAVPPPAPGEAVAWRAALELMAPLRQGCDLEIGPGDPTPPAP